MTAKLTITPQSPSKLPAVVVPFNPRSYSIQKPVTWSPPNAAGSADKKSTQTAMNAPILIFGGGGSRILTLNLFFDSTESGTPLQDVRKQTNGILGLSRIEPIDPVPKPPVCKISWGADPPSNSDFPFSGVVSNLTQEFTLFNSDGLPLRANLTVVFTEYIDPEIDKRKTDPELTTHLLRRGDSLASLSAQYYGDPQQWRLIAQANRLDDARSLTIGRLLTIPKLG
jgi:nucleoid-associated protein YgaU